MSGREPDEATLNDVWSAVLRTMCGSTIDASMEDRHKALDIARAALSAIGSGTQPAPSDMLADLVARFSAALLDKLRAAEQKYGWENGWTETGWEADCQQALLKHIDKGDPRDVAAYCAFLWHHGWRTVGSGTQGRDAVIEECALMAAREAEECERGRLSTTDPDERSHWLWSKQTADHIADAMRALASPEKVTAPTPPLPPTTDWKCQISGNHPWAVNQDLCSCGVCRAYREAKTLPPTPPVASDLRKRVHLTMLDARREWAGPLAAIDTEHSIIERHFLELFITVRAEAKAEGIKETTDKYESRMIDLIGGAMAEGRAEGYARGKAEGWEDAERRLLKEAEKTKDWPNTAASAFRRAVQWLTANRPSPTERED